MKSILVVLVVVLLASCQNSHKERVIKSDTVRNVMVEKPDSTLMFFKKAVLVVREYRGLPSDSTSSQVEWVRDTILSQAFVLKDTLRNALHKPIYDSASKSYKMDSAWQNIPPYNPKTVRFTYFK